MLLRVVILGSLSLGAALTTSALIRHFAAARNSRPIVECASMVDLGEREFAETATGQFRLANRGDAELIVDRIQSSCSCAGVEMKEEGEWRRVEKLRLAPGASVELAVRIAVGARPGNHQRVLVVLSTNEPDRPQRVIEFLIPRVKGGAYPRPNAIMFGEVPVGSRPTQTVRLYDNGVRSRRVAKVVSSHPDRFDVRLTKVADDQNVEVDETGGRLIALLEVTPLTNKPGPLDGAVAVHLAGENRPPDSIPVLGEAILPVTCSPPCLVLPRMVNGRPVFTGEIVIASRAGRPLDVVTKSCPPGVHVAPSPSPADSAEAVLGISYSSDKNTTEGAKKRVELEVQVIQQGGAPIDLEIPILILEGPP